MPDLKAFTTTYQFPYPLPGDSVQNTYTRIQELAERIEATYTTLGINLDSATALMQVGDAAGGDLAGSTYPNPTIASNAITTSKINDAAVTTVKIADSNVTTGKIANDAVTTAKLDVVDLKDGSTAVTQAQSDGSTKVATTAYVDSYITGTVPDGSIGTSKLADGAVTNVKVNASAAIAYSKLNLANSIVNADVAAGAAIAYSKLALTGSITEADLSFSVATQSELDTVASNATTALSNHESDTTSIHGITDTANLVYTNDSRLTDSRTPTGGAGGVLSGTYPNPGFAVDMATQSELDSHESDTTSVHGIADTSVLATATDVSTAVSTHSSATTSIHGISNTADLVLTNDARLTDARTPTSHAATHIPNGSDAIDLTKIIAIGAALPTLPDALYPAGTLFGVGAVAPYLLYRSTGSVWDQIGGAGGSSVTTSDTAPATPSDGDLWYKTSNAKTYVWYEDGSSDQWVEVGAASQLVIPQHGSDHVRGGADVIDGDRLTVDYVPTRYTRNSAASGAGDNTDLTAHLSGIDSRFAPALVTSLPGSPYDGQVIYYQAKTNADSIIWQLRYNSSSSSSYKWEFVGGTPLRDQNGSYPAAMTASGSWVDITGGPTLVLPFSGDYYVQFTIKGDMTSGNAGTLVMIEPATATVTPQGYETGSFCIDTSNLTTVVREHTTATKKMVSVTAGETLKLQLKLAIGAMTVVPHHGQMTVIPIRIG